MIASPVIRLLASCLACATLLAGCRDSTEPGLGCVRPAPLAGQPDPRAPGYIVQFRDGVAVRAEVNRLAAKYAFTPTSVYESAYRGFAGFAAVLAPATLTGLRCESSILRVEHNAIVGPATLGRRTH